MATTLLSALTDTWNNAGTAFDAIKMDVTNTASLAGSNLMNLLTDGNQRFEVDRDGVVFIRQPSPGGPAIQFQNPTSNHRLAFLNTAFDFGTYVNDTWGFDYNPDQTIGQVRFTWSWEMNYEDGGTGGLFEHHWNYTNKGQTVIGRRHINHNIELDTDLAEFAFDYIKRFRVVPSDGNANESVMNLLGTVGQRSVSFYTGDDTATGATITVEGAQNCFFYLRGTTNRFLYFWLRENASAINTVLDSWGISLQGKYWDGGASQGKAVNLIMNILGNDQWVTGFEIDGASGTNLDIREGRLAGVHTTNSPATAWHVNSRTTSSAENLRLDCNNSDIILNSRNQSDVSKIRWDFDASGNPYCGFGVSPASYAFQVSSPPRGTVCLGITPSSAAANDIHIFLSTPAITGNWNWFSASANATGSAQALFENQNTGSGANARFEMKTASAAAGDPYMLFTVSGATNVAIGIDNSDGDKLKIVGNDNPSNTPVLAAFQNDAGTAKVGLYAKAPVAQAAKINDPSGGATQDAEARTAINAIIDALEGIGISAAV